jgi:hypothetical protein
MPIYKSLGQFNKECSGFPNTLRRAMFAGVNASALATKRSVLASAEAQRWPLRRQRGKRMPVVVVHYTIASGGQNPTALVALKNGSMYEFGAKEHEIRPKGRRSKLRAVTTPYGPFARVHHPGFTGRRFWHQGVATARPVVQRIFGAAVVKSVGETFKSTGVV